MGGWGIGFRVMTSPPTPPPLPGPLTQRGPGKGGSPSDQMESDFDRVEDAAERDGGYRETILADRRFGEDD